ncbi:MAG: aspartate carbamoyltransferase [Burkholderiales bacterium]|jgi:aspartate carbamoyltransferase catalytic subunit|nr:aspartate carbamoyltransferase [Burkholderiales bacterium]
MHSLVSISDLSKNDILDILNLARKFKEGKISNTLSKKVIASCFFEASTRTRLSFDSAIQRLGGSVIGFADSNNTSLANKGESLSDTLKIIGAYADALIIRHPQDGAARLASEVCNIPIINAGDGANQHPTQTLLDLFAIMDTQDKLDGINLGIMGDLKHGRTVHSLIEAAKLFNMSLFFISPKELRMGHDQLFSLKQSSIHYSFHIYAEEIIDKLDCLYMTRVQKERFVDIDGVNFDSYCINLNTLEKARTNLKILHPLPRREELPSVIDDTPYAHYFKQAADGLFVRMALLEILFATV